MERFFLLPCAADAAGSPSSLSSDSLLPWNGPTADGAVVFLLRQGESAPGIVARGVLQPDGLKLREVRPDCVAGLLPWVLLTKALPDMGWATGAVVELDAESGRKLDELWEGGRGRHSLAQYSAWSQADSWEQDWKRDYSATVQWMRKMDTSSLEADGLYVVWKKGSNGICTIRQGVLSNDEFSEQNLPLLRELAHAIKNAPNQGTYRMVMQRWQAEVGAGHFKSMKRAVIHRVFAGFAPERYTTLVNLKDAKYLLEWLRAHLQMDVALDGDWVALNAELQRCLREAGLEPGVENNIVLWRLFSALGDMSASAAPEEGGFVEFRQKGDTGYLEWLRQNPEGWVLNSWSAPKPDYLILHRAGCATISSMVGTGLLKVCSPDEEGIKAWLTSRGFEQPSSCHHICCPDHKFVSTHLEKAMPSAPLNQILYGPPGTGKTFNTINKALEILDPGFLRENGEDRTELKRRFDELVEEGRIAFTTFHQSFSYEDFVEGLRATSDENGQISYVVEDGVFKRLCQAAESKVTKSVDVSLDLTGRRIWKMSLGNTLDDSYSLYDECVQNNYILLGYGNDFDFSSCQNRDDVVRVFEQNGYSVDKRNDYSVTAVSTFLFKMRPGDLVVVTDGNLKFRAIGEVCGDYELLSRNDDYHEFAHQCRRVKWLRAYRPSLPYDQLMNNRFSQMTLYELSGDAIDLGKLSRLLQSDTDAGAQGDAARPATHNPRVLIIDEINRGNISRIFGELITLIEPSKRAGADEALEVVLPYSKQRFSVPDNIYLIGTMNTADRSLAGLDLALRRRFSFTEMPPRPELLDDVVVEDDEGREVNIGAMLRVINQRIAVLLDRDHAIGHAYFMPLQDDPSLERLAAIFRNAILPLLQEYFFEDWQRIHWVLNDHQKPKAQRFIVEDVSLDVGRLFGQLPELAQRQQRWELNPSAFDNVASYAGIVDARRVSGVLRQEEEGELA